MTQHCSPGVVAVLCTWRPVAGAVFSDMRHTPHCALHVASSAAYRQVMGGGQRLAVLLPLHCVLLRCRQALDCCLGLQHHTCVPQGRHDTLLAQAQEVRTGWPSPVGLVWGGCSTPLSLLTCGQGQDAGAVTRCRKVAALCVCHARHALCIAYRLVAVAYSASRCAGSGGDTRLAWQSLLRAHCQAFAFGLCLHLMDPCA